MARIPRIYIEKSRWPEEIAIPVQLVEKEVHYLMHVLRLRTQEKVYIFDGQGRVALCSLDQKKGVFELVVHTLETVSNSGDVIEITLVQSLLKQDKLDLIVEKATELGVKRFIPILSTRSNVHFSKEREQAKMERWHKITQAASAQCGRLDNMLIEKVQPFSEVIKRQDFEKIICYEENQNARSLVHVWVHAKNREISVWIGPEGGFSKEEIEMALHHGSVLCTLGSNILRAETASLCAISILKGMNTAFLQ